MYLHHISIKNFRLFKDFELVLNKGMNVLVGENDSGKTSLIDAIRYTLGTSTFEKTYIQETDFSDGCKTFSITLKFDDIDKYAHIFLEHLTHELIDEIATKPVLYITLKAQLSGKEKRGYPLIKTELRSGFNGDGPTIEPELKSFLSATYLKPLRDAEIELSSGRRSRFSQILCSSKEFKDINSVDKTLKLIAETNRELLAEGSSIASISRTIRDNYLHNLVFDTDKEILQAVIDIAGIKTVDNLSEGEKKRFLRGVLETLSLSLSNDSRSHGLGYLNLLFIAAELLLLEPEAGEESVLLLIEEPEAHLHPQLQFKLLSFLLSKTQEGNNDFQCVLTTHSPSLASKVNPEHLIMMHQGIAHSLRSSETVLAPQDYFFLQKFLDSTKSNLFFSKAVLLVEGDAENILLPTIFKLLNKPIENYGITIVNIGNTGWKHFAKIFLRKEKDESAEFWLPIKVAVLRDLDLWPDCAEKKDENLYGFKERKPANKEYWRSSVSDLSHHVATMKDGLEKQNVKVYISDQWTFEYCLAYYGLFKQCYCALHGIEKVEALEDDLAYQELLLKSKEEQSTYILSKAKNIKTGLAQKIARKLEKDFISKDVELRSVLPPYLCSAIDFVTS